MKTSLDYRQQLDEIDSNIHRSVTDPTFKRDLLKMAHTAHTAITHLSSEEVVCRSRNAVTPTQERLIANVEDILSNLEHHVVMAVLSS